MAAAPEKILVVDDEEPVRELLAGILTRHGYRVDVASDGVEAVEKLDKDLYSICLTDIRMPRLDGLGVLKHIQDNKIDTIGIVATGYSSLQNAIEALRHGAFDYLIKPFHVEEINVAVNRAIELRQLRRENVQLRRDMKQNFSVKNMIGTSPPVQEVFNLINAVADSDSTVLILGESGTGKELVARAIHQESPRAKKVMAPVNCGALPENLLESELFGHVKGAFTGAVATRPGRFQLADGGTIFLDEIGEMSPQLQVKLLRVLQEGQFEMVGSTKTVTVDARVIAATNRNLEEMVERGEFREDLFYRLNVIPINIPPLRERMDDVTLLIDHFIHRFNTEKGRAFQGFTEEALQALQRYEWPGNVRELENLVERCVILHPDTKVTVEQLPEKYRSGEGGVSGPPLSTRFPDDGVDLNDLIERYETHLIEQALEKAGGVKNRAAQLLGIKRTTLVEKMKKRGMTATK